MADSPRRSRRLAGLPPSEFEKPRAVPEAEAGVGGRQGLPQYYSPGLVRTCEKVVMGVLGVLTTIPLLKLLF